MAAGTRGVRLVTKGKLPALVRTAVELSEARQHVEHWRVAMMGAYAHTDGCRRQFLLGYFGENLPHPCGNCTEAGCPGWSHQPGTGRRRQGGGREGGRRRG